MANPPVPACRFGKSGKAMVMPNEALAELRHYRNLARRRDALIRRARSEGATYQKISVASGLSLRRVRFIATADRKGRKSHRF